MSPGTKSRLFQGLRRQLPHLGLTQQLRLGFGLVALTTAISGALSVAGFQRVARHAEAASLVLAEKIESGEAGARAPDWYWESSHSAVDGEERRGIAGADPKQVLARLRAVSANARRSETHAMGFAVAAGLLALAASLGLIQRIRGPLRALSDALHLPRRPDSGEDNDKPSLGAEVDLGAAVQAAQVFQTEAIEARTRLADAEVKGAQLAQTNDELEGFVRSVTHDLKAPLASMTGFLRIAREALEEGDTQGAIPLLRRAEQASLRADKLVRELLELAKIGRSGEPEALHIGDEIARTLDELDGAIAAADMAIDVTPQLGVAFIDPRAMRQILGNVIGNAVKYGSSDAAPVLRIASTQTGRGLQVRISDNGPGIPLGARGRAFAPFERLTDSGEGSGLGLSLVERAMANAGGTVTVEDTPGGGATFVLHFPSPAEWGLVENAIPSDMEPASGTSEAHEYGD